MKSIYLALIVLFLPVLLFSQIYVNQNAAEGGNGSSWDSAYTHIVTAVNSAESGDDIWIAKGTYILPNDVNSIIITQPISLYGGFSGVENEVSQRDIVENETIISGDRNSDDIVFDTTSTTDNAAHVLEITIDTGKIHIDGLTISGGASSRSGVLGDDDASGGGILLSGAADFVDCIFKNNSARFGGGVYVKNTGALATFTDCHFENNVGTRFGGGLYADDPNNHVEILRGSFQGNLSESGGGVIVGSAGSSAILNGVAFINNSAVRGAGFQVDLGGSASLTDCTFNGNKARLGGGLRVQGGANALVDNSTFTNNEAVVLGSDRPEGGAVHVVRGSSMTMTNSTLTGNTAEGAGGALSIKEGSTCSITACDLSDNIGDLGGGAILAQNDVAVQSSDNIFRSNRSGEDGVGGAVVIDEASFMRSNNDHFEENISSDGGAIYLEEDSGLDVKSSKFIKNSAFFSGAISIAGAGSMFSVDDATFSENDAISGGAIYVYNGPSTVVTNSNFDNNTSETGGAVILENSGDSRFYNSHFSKNIVTSDDGSGGAIYLRDNTLKVEECTFNNNEASVDGGAISAFGSGTLHVINSELRANKATYGAAIEAEGNELIIEGSTVIDNMASSFGGGLCVWEGASLHSDGNTFAYNKSFIGGAFSIDGGQNESLMHEVLNTKFEYNYGSDGGGAINHFNAHLLIENSLFDGNTTDVNGAAIWSEDDGDVDNPLIIRNVTMINNDGGDGGVIAIGGEDGLRAHKTLIQNTIMANEAKQFAFIDMTGAIESTGGNLSIQDDGAYLNHESDQINTDPLFVDVSLRNYRLQDISPAINAGVSPAPFMDIIGEQRLDIPDIGAYENENIVEGLDYAVPGRVYVNPWAKGKSDGLTWRTAFKNIYDGLRFAEEGDDVWIAKGIYTVPEDMDGWMIDKGLSVFGGFRGAERELNDRVDGMHGDFRTILSGDRNGDDNNSVLEQKEDNAYHILNINTDENLVYLNELTFTNGGQGNIAEGDDALGGAVIVSGRVTFDRVRFLDNVNRQGGAIYVRPGSHLTKVVDSYFSRNFANNAGGSIYGNESNIMINSSRLSSGAALRGGALYALGGDVMISDSTQMHDNRGVRGGAIYLSGSTASVDASSFRGNEVTPFNDISAAGGAFYAFENTVFSISNSIFVDNSSEIFGGVGFSEGADLSLMSNYFQSNKAGQAGVIQFQESNLHSSNNRYTENSVEGETAFGGVFVFISSEAHLTEDHFANNKASFGGAMYYSESKGSITSTHLTSNEAMLGGAICNFGKNDIVLEAVNLTENNANYGGAIHMGEDGKYSVWYSVFDRNIANNDGAGIYANSNSYLEVFGSEFHGNAATSSSGAIHLRQCSSDISNSIFKNNAADFGGAMLLDSAVAFLDSCRFIKNTAVVSGGGMYSYQNSLLNIGNSLFNYNEATDFGGGIYTETATLDIASTQFRNNKATTGAGIESYYGLGLTVDNGMFLNNEAEIGGGLYSGETPTTISNSEFNSNNASLFGGGLNVQNTDTDQNKNLVTSTKFINNYGALGGGGINHYDGELRVENSLFDRNRADASGTAIWTEDDGANANALTLVNNTIYNADISNDALIAVSGDDGQRGQTVISQNNIYVNQGPNFDLLRDDAEIVSSGGNLSQTADSIHLNLTSDIHGVDPLFVDAENFNFRLTDESPAVNAGVSPATFTDILGNARLGEPDIGAYENQNVIEKSNFNNIKEDKFLIQVSPNPVPDQFRFVIPKKYKGRYTVDIIGMDGTVFGEKRVIKGAGIMEMDADFLPSGTYYLGIVDSESLTVARAMFVKQ